MNDEIRDKFITFKKIIRECDYDNTYKMAWARALVEISSEVELTEDKSVISLSSIAEKYLKYYWNQTIYFDLVQGSNLVKPPEVVTITKRLIDQYYLVSESKKPIRFERFESSLYKWNLEKDYSKAIGKIVTVLKKDVSWRFLNVQGSDIKVYQYKQGDNELLIDSELLGVLHENELDLYDLINYRWGMILENFNNSPRISKKVKILDEQELKRNSLSKYKKYLDIENIEHKCFICGETILDNEISIDHVIPWGYMYSDDIWNLVYVHKSCNSKKGIVIPDKESIDKLKERNKRLLAYMEGLYTGKQLNELKFANEHDYVEKFWVGCKG